MNKDDTAIYSFVYVSRGSPGMVGKKISVHAVSSGRHNDSPFLYNSGERALNAINEHKATGSWPCA